MSVFLDGDIQIIIHSIISEHLSQKNASYYPLNPEEIGDGRLESQPYHFDSLGLVALATHVGDFFGVKNSGLEEFFLRHRDIKSWVAIIRDSLKRYDSTVTFMTSGTTGKPKRVEHPLEHIQKEVQYLASLLKGADCIHSFVRPHHIYGFIYTILLPKALNIPVFYNEPLPNNSFFNTMPNSLIIATPILYSHLDLFSQNFAPKCTLISSTQALEPQTYSLLQEKKAYKIYEFYGSSESMGVGYKNSAHEPFTLFDYHQKSNLPSIQDSLEFIDERHFFVKNREDGLVKYRGYKLDLKGYENQLYALKGTIEARVDIAKGSLVCFIKTDDKEALLKEIALLNPRPDQIIWI